MKARDNQNFDRSVRRCLSTCLLLLTLAPATGMAITPYALPWAEGFEGYAQGTALNTSALTNQGWGATADTVIIQTNVVNAACGTNALAIPAGKGVSSVVVGAVSSNVWSEWYVYDTSRMPVESVGADDLNTNMTVQFFIETNGYPVVWSPLVTNWIVFSTDYRGQPVSTFSTNRWQRLTLCSDYEQGRAALFLDEHLLLEQLPFMNADRTHCTLLQVDGGELSTTYLDHVSMQYMPPTNNGFADLDDDGMSDALEIQLYGSITNHHRPMITVMTSVNGTVSPAGACSVLPGGQTNFILQADVGYYVSRVFTNGQDAGSFPGQYTNNASYTWTNIVPDGLSDVTFDVEFLRKPQLTITTVPVGGPSASGGVASLSATEIFPGGQVTCRMTGDTAYVVSAVLTNGSVNASFDGQSRVLSHVIGGIWADLLVTAQFTYTGQLHVPDDYPTIAAALAAALPGDTITVSGGSYTNNLTLDKAVTLQGSNVTVAGSVEIQSGVTVTLAEWQGLAVTGVTTVEAGALLVLSNGSVDLGTLSIAAGGTVQVVNATSVVVNGATRTGTFTMVSGWDSTVVAQTPPYSDPFERYAVGTKMSEMGVFGWEAAYSAVLVQTNQAQSGRAVEIPAALGLASVMTPTPALNVWVEWYCLDKNRVSSERLGVDDVDVGRAVIVCINTNGYLTVFDPVQSCWDVCSTDFQGTNVLPLAVTDWARISVHLNYMKTNAAVFLNGRLMRQQLRFINTHLDNSGRFEVMGGTDGSTYIDTFSVRTNWVGIVSEDAAQDGWDDAYEIDRFGNTFSFPAPITGSIFRFR